MEGRRSVLWSSNNLGLWSALTLWSVFSTSCICSSIFSAATLTTCIKRSASWTSKSVERKEAMRFGGIFCINPTVSESNKGVFPRRPASRWYRGSQRVDFVREVAYVRARSSKTIFLHWYIPPVRHEGYYACVFVVYRLVFGYGSVFALGR